MKFRKETSELYIPDGMDADSALARTTDIGICAHQDDLEILSYPGILACFGSDVKWFAGVCVTNGAGSPRDGLYKDYTDDEMRAVRRIEQKKAAYVGEYGSMSLLDFSSSEVKDPNFRGVIDDLKDLFAKTRPSTVWTHNPADKHDTHVGVCLRVIQAIRELPADVRPEKAYGLEVWRDLDWLPDSDKKVFDVAGHDNLAAALLGVFDSQIAGGKRYDLATLGRRSAHATYYASHGTDDSTQISFGMDLTPLVTNPSLDVKQFVGGLIDGLKADVHARIDKFI